MLLYHPSQKKFKVVKVKYFGNNCYTLGDMKSCSIERAFYYLTPIIPEKLFIRSKYIYVIKVADNKIYDLRADKKKLIPKYPTIEALMAHIKRYYTGAVYNIGIYDIVCVFKDMKPMKIIERR